MDYAYEISLCRVQHTRADLVPLKYFCTLRFNVKDTIMCVILLFE